MSSNPDSIQTILQKKFLDFALIELVSRHRESFQPLWTIDSWAKFLIWAALNCELSGERESLDLFAESLGPALTSRMRRLFFERTLESLSLKLMADPAELQVLVIHLDGGLKINYSDTEKALNQVGLIERVVMDTTFWQPIEAGLAIPWRSSDVKSNSE